MAADNLLRSWAIWVDGVGNAGNAKEYSPPALTIITDDFQAGDMDTSIPVDVGMEPMEASFVLFGVDPAVLSLLGLQGGARKSISVRSTYTDLNNNAWDLVEELRGLIVSVERDSLGTSDRRQNGMTVTIKPEYYKVRRGESVLVEIDPVNGVRNMGGNDVLADVRKLMQIV